MTQGKFQIILISLIALCTLTSVFAFTSYDFCEFDKAADWTLKYFSLPTLIIMAPTSYFIYLKFIIQHEKKKFKSPTWTYLRSVLRIFILTLGLTAILYATTLSTIIISNTFGNCKTINLDAIVTDYYSTNNRGRTSYYIKINDRQLDRIVKLKVSRPFEIGQPFRKTMKIGCWGLLFSER
jgi:hypothetical protein